MKNWVLKVSIFALILAGLAACHKDVDSTSVTEAVSPIDTFFVVTTSPLGGGVHITPLPSGNEQIIITPSVTQDGVITFLAVTRNNFPCLNNLLLISKTGDTFDDQLFVIAGVGQPTNCTAGSKQATGSSSLLAMADGIYHFRIISNVTTYSGSVAKTGNRYVFTWAYTDGIVITPLTVSL